MQSYKSELRKNLDILQKLLEDFVKKFGLFGKEKTSRKFNEILKEIKENSECFEKCLG